MVVGCAEAVEEHARPCPGNIRYEDFTLEESDPAEQLEALRGVTEVVGNLSIRGDVDSLEALSCLVRVEGGLTVYSEVETLGGLERLESVGALNLASSRLRHVDALSNLTAIRGDTWLEELPAIESLAGLDSVSTVGGLMLRDVASGAALTLDVGETFPGTITVFGESPDLTPLTGKLRRVVGDVRLEGSSVGRVDLSGLLRVDGALTLTTTEAQLLPQLGSLERVVQDVTLSGFADEGLTALARLQSAASLSISSFPNLRTLDGLQALRTLVHGEIPAMGAGLGLRANPQLVDLTALSGIEHVSGAPNSIVFLTISDSPLLSDLSGTQAVVPLVDWVSLSDLPALVDLQSWPVLPRLPAFFAERTGLVTLDGLAIAPGSWVRGFDDQVAFELYDNPDLVDVSAAIPDPDDEVSAGGFIFMSGNPNLSQCSAEALVQAAQAGGFAGDVALEDLVDDTPCE